MVNSAMLTTEKAAAILRVAPQSLRKHHCLHGHYYGVRPIKHPNGSLLWRADEVYAMPGVVDVEVAAPVAVAANDVLRIARIAHEINRAYCLAIGDNSQPAWDDAPEWQRASAISGVVFRQANPDADPEASHQSWLDHKVADGWKYGPAKDVALKEHPCCVPYAELPAEQKAKDYLFCAVVKQFS